MKSDYRVTPAMAYWLSNQFHQLFWISDWCLQFTHH